MSSNPFSSDILEDAPAESVRGVLLHEEQFEVLGLHLAELRDTSLAAGGRGELVLLKAPRAGYGKSYLLARLGKEFKKSHCFLPVRFQREREVGWEELFADLLETCDDAREPRSRENPSILEEVARQVFGALTAALIRSGEIPCADPEKVIQGLESDASEVFDFGDPESESVKWFGGVFESLLGSYGREAIKRYTISYEQALFWLRELSVFSRDCVREGVNREALLSRFMVSDVVGWRGGSREISFRAKCRTLLRMLADTRPVVLLIDSLDDFYGEGDRGRSIALLVKDMAEFSPASMTVLSVNEDLWGSTFSAAIPGALEDRLTGTVITLGGITREQAALLIEERLKGAGIPDDVKFRFQPLLDLDAFFEGGRSGGRKSPREVLRYGKECWARFEATDYGHSGEAPAAESEPGWPRDQGVDTDKAASPKKGVEFISLSEPFPEIEAEEASRNEEAAETPGEAFTLADSQPEPLAPAVKAGESARETEPWPGMALPDFDALFGCGAAADTEPAGTDPSELSATAKAPAEGEEERPGETMAPLEPADENAHAEGLPKLAPLRAADEAARAAREKGGKGADKPPQAGAPRPENAAKPLASFRKLIRLITGDDSHKREEDEEEPSGAEDGEAPAGAANPGEPGARTLEQFAQLLSDETRGYLPSYFNRLRRTAAESAGGSPLDLRLIGGVARVVGSVLPMIRQRELESPGRIGGRALRWVCGEDEILLAFEPAEDEGFWAEMLELAPGNGEPAGRGREEEDTERENGWQQGDVDVKLVALTAGWDESGLSALERLRESAAGKSVSLDVIAIDPETAGALYAGAQLIEEVESGALAHELRDVVNLLIQELDYFWRWVTRPAAACETP